MSLVNIFQSQIKQLALHLIHTEEILLAEPPLNIEISFLTILVKF